MRCAAPPSIFFAPTLPRLDATIWFMNGTAVASSGAVGPIALDWVVQGTNAN